MSSFTCDSFLRLSIRLHRHGWSCRVCGRFAFAETRSNVWRSREFAKKGYRVAILARGAESVQKLSDELVKSGADVRAPQQQHCCLTPLTHHDRPRASPSLLMITRHFIPPLRKSVLRGRVLPSEWQYGTPATACGSRSSTSRPRTCTRARTQPLEPLLLPGRRSCHSRIRSEFGRGWVWHDQAEHTVATG